MAYAQQQPRHAGPQRPYYEHQQSLCASTAQSYAAEYEYAERDTGSQYNDHARGVPPQQYPDSSGGGRSYANGQSGWLGDNAQYGNGGQYGGRGQHAGGRQGAQRSQKPKDIGGYAHREARNRVPPHVNSRFPSRDQYQQQERGYQSSGHRETQCYETQYPPEQGRQQANGNYGYNIHSYPAQNTWQQAPQYGQRTTDDGSNRFSDPNHEVGGQHQGFAGEYVRDPSADQRGNVLNAGASQKETAAPRPVKGQSRGSSARSESSQRSKHPPKRIIESPKSPETISWDNPFPTFPTKPKKGAYSNSRSLDGSSGSNSLKDASQEKIFDSRPETPSSKTSSHTVHQPQAVEEAVRNHNNHNGAFPSLKSRWPLDAQQNRDAAPKRRSTSSNGGRVDQLIPPNMAGRHSEDNRTRPTIPADGGVGSGYERSRTMPTAISETMIKPGPQSWQPEQSAWQDLGPVAGYYGPEDKAYLPISPEDNGFQHRPYGQTRAHSDESRPYGHGAVQTQNGNARQSLAPHDSIADFFDGYYDASQQDYQPYVPEHGNQYRSLIDEDMPNFDVVPDPGAIHRRGMTIDRHLQPPQTAQEYPPLPAPPSDDGRRRHRNNPNPNNRFPPRSKSQPNLKDKRALIAEDGQSFSFGAPGHPNRPPALASAAIGYASVSSTPRGYSNGRPQGRDRPIRGRSPQGSIPASGYRSDAKNRPTYPPPKSDLPSIPYQNNAPTDRYRSPALQDGRSREGQRRPPVARPSEGTSPIDRNQPSFEYQNSTEPDQSRSRPIQHDRSRGAQMRPPGGGPSATNGIGPPVLPEKPPINPDSLPLHPAPVRPGLIEDSSVNPAAKPPPVRQYNATPSPMQQSNPTRNPGSSHTTDGKSDPSPVTPQELEQLRQATARRPDDMATQLTLAKKLIEAASVLVDERADARVKAKTREKYNSDALRIVKKLSSNGYIEANFYLADAYSRGSLGLESDTREAFKLYQAAAKAGHRQAAYRVAVCCEIGQEEGGGTSRDAVKAMQWYKRAATLGDTPAMYKMGVISLKGLLGQPRHPREALIWLKKAAERADRENPHALHELALLHEKGNPNDGVQKDEAYSSQLFAQAARLGYKFSQFRLGCMYEYGLLGYPVDPRQSIAWYSKAAVQGEHQSELALSGWYLTGADGILQQSDTEAYLWARKAAQAGLAKAEYAMGYFTEVGFGAPANMEDAKRWYWRAASQNFQKARDRLDDLRKGGGTKQKMRVSRSNMKKQSDGECLVM